MKGYQQTENSTKNGRWETMRERGNDDFCSYKAETYML